jgi:Holliday junction resolvase RusA-like endonuclease
MKKELEEAFYINPFYDGVMMFKLKNPVPPKQRKGKAQNNEFEKYLRNHLCSVQHQSRWPLTTKILICLSATGPEKWIENCDIDNIAKAVLDCFKGIVIEDDKQVYALFADKRIDENNNGIIVGVKEIIGHNDYFGLNIPYYFLDEELATNKDVWWLIFGDSKP